MPLFNPSNRYIGPRPKEENPREMKSRNPLRDAHRAYHESMAMGVGGESAWPDLVLDFVRISQPHLIISHPTSAHVASASKFRIGTRQG